MSWEQIEERARLEADGEAPAAMIAELESDPVRWRNVLTDMIEDAEDTLNQYDALKGHNETRSSRTSRPNSGP